MPGNLKSGHFDGYCVGEPWNTVATAAGFGWRVATSADVAPWHPEKVLMVRREFAESRAAEHERLIAALLEACCFCAAPENRDQVIETLSAPNCLNSSREVLRDSFAATGHVMEFSTEAHEPSREKAAWVIDNMLESGLLPKTRNNRALAAKIFRPDIFQNAIRNHPHHELANAIHRN
jgi:ABC-type nitrate/sulfonate/bicarbonate transport system substrate-binding protein